MYYFNEEVINYKYSSFKVVLTEGCRSCCMHNSLLNWCQLPPYVSCITKTLDNRKLSFISFKKYFI